jgi:hypothetical protein
MRLSVIICSADIMYLDLTNDRIKELGAEVVTKPFGIDHFLQVVKQLLIPTST